MTPGVPPELCADGFSPTEFGCEPVLSQDPCLDGQMAVPGDAACHDVAPCASGEYPEATPGQEVQYVNAESPRATADLDCGTIGKP